LIVVNGRHLKRILTNYFDYYHRPPEITPEPRQSRG